jgi:hypothetical protein
MAMETSRLTGVGWDLEPKGERTRFSDATGPVASDAGRRDLDREPIRQRSWAPCQMHDVLRHALRITLSYAPVVPTLSSPPEGQAVESATLARPGVAGSRHFTAPSSRARPTH